MKIRIRPRTTARSGNYSPKVNYNFILPIVSPGQEYENLSEMTNTDFIPGSGTFRFRDYLVWYLMLQ